MFKSLLWQISGVDANILGEIPAKWKRKYFRAGIGMFLIGILCMVSGGYTFWVIFGNAFFAIPFSLIWAWVLLNLYRLVLITVGNPHIPHAPRYRFPFGSFLFRTIFLLVLGLFVVKPIEMLVFSGLTKPYLEQHRATVLAQHAAKTAQFKEAKIQEIFAGGNTALERANENGYLMTRLEILHREFPAVWCLTLSLIWIFLWPFWSRVAWRRKSEYEILRGTIEKELVVREYLRFKELFVAHMLALTGRDDIWEERYKDMPFGNAPILRKEKDYMHPGSIYGWARIHATEGENGEGK